MADKFLGQFLKFIFVTADGFHGMGGGEGSGSRRWCDGVERRWRGGDRRQQPEVSMKKKKKLKTAAGAGYTLVKRLRFTALI